MPPARSKRLRLFPTIGFHSSCLLSFSSFASRFLFLISFDTIHRNYHFPSLFHS